MAIGLSQARQRDGNPRWRGGGVVYQWYGQSWRRQSDRARQRDNHTCQVCGISEADLGYKLRVHHIKPFSSFNSVKQANRLNNLISLCESCHKTIDNSQPIKNIPRFIALPFHPEPKPILQVLSPL